MNPLLEEAIKEAYASAPSDTVILYTMEINHKSFEQPVRVCRYPSNGPDLAEFTMLIESDAERDAGEFVTFYGVPFELELPERSQDTPGEFQITVSGAAHILEEYLENACTQGGSITAIFRTYIEGREDEGPTEVWPDIYLHSPYVDSTTGDVVMRGSVLDWINRKFGRLITPGKYPALVG